MEALNMAHLDSISGTSPGWARYSSEGGSWRPHVQVPPPDVPCWSLPHIWVRVCLVAFPTITTRWWSVDSLAPLFTWVSKTNGSSDVQPQSQHQSLASDVLVSSRHMNHPTHGCTKYLFVSDQSANSFQLPPLQVSPSLPVWPLKSPSRTIVPRLNPFCH